MYCFFEGINWRLRSESNRRPRLCRPLHNHSATQPSMLCNVGAVPDGKNPGLFPGVSCMLLFGAGNEIRTRDPNLGKVVLYQLSYSRDNSRSLYRRFMACQEAIIKYGSIANTLLRTLLRCSFTDWRPRSSQGSHPPGRGVRYTFETGSYVIPMVRGRVAQQDGPGGPQVDDHGP